MEKRLFLFGGLAAVAATGCARQSEAPARPMNILYIMTDDHTAQMMSCYDTRYASTPNLDRIAVEGVRFTNSFVANSLSGPSRACMLTGKHSHKNGFYDNTTCVFDNTQQTFPKLLQQAGYCFWQRNCTKLKRISNAELWNSHTILLCNRSYLRLI